MKAYFLLKSLGKFYIFVLCEERSSLSGHSVLSLIWSNSFIAHPLIHIHRGHFLWGIKFPHLSQQCLLLLLLFRHFGLWTKSLSLTQTWELLDYSMKSNCMGEGKISCCIWSLSPWGKLQKWGRGFGEIQSLWPYTKQQLSGSGSHFKF